MGTKAPFYLIMVPKSTTFQETCKIYHLVIKRTNYVAEMANGVSQPFNVLKSSTEIQLKGYTEKVYFAVCPLKRYEAILGKRWLSEHKTHLDCAKSKIEFRFENKKIIVIADENRHHSFVSFNSNCQRLCL